MQVLPRTAAFAAQSHGGDDPPDRRHRRRYASSRRDAAPIRTSGKAHAVRGDQSGGWMRPRSFPEGGSLCGVRCGDDQATTVGTQRSDFLALSQHPLRIGGDRADGAHCSYHLIQQITARSPSRNLLRFRSIRVQLLARLELRARLERTGSSATYPSKNPKMSSATGGCIID
jgi:hypothetical protein